MLLAAVLEFVGGARQLPGVQKIALIGSLATTKPIPKDADVLVTIQPGLELGELARLGRRLKARTQAINLGADIFLAEPGDRYIGRICAYRACHPRVACRARTCALGRQYLNDDLHILTLKPELLRAPPIDLWPVVVRHCTVPRDVEERLLQPLDSQSEP